MIEMSFHDDAVDMALRCVSGPLPDVARPWWSGSRRPEFTYPNYENNIPESHRRGEEAREMGPAGCCDQDSRQWQVRLQVSRTTRIGSDTDMLSQCVRAASSFSALRHDRATLCRRPR